MCDIDFDGSAGFCSQTHPVARNCIADYASLDAADYGVPQHRIRPFWFGHLEGPCIAWPLPTHGAPSDNGQLLGTELKPWVTCRDALQHLPFEQLGRPVHLRRRRQEDCGHPSSEPDAPAHGLPASMAGNGGRTLFAHPDHRMSSPGAPAKTLTRNTHGDGTILVNDRHSPASPAPTLGAKIRGQAGQVLDLREPKPNHPISRLAEPAFVVKTNGGRASQAGSMMELAEPRPHHRISTDRPARTLTTARQDDSKLIEWPWNRPSTTIQRDERIPPPGHHDEYSTRSMPNAVVLSELAATILQGFPESWCFSGKTKTARWSQLGQAMPPPLAEAVARSVVQQMERTKTGRVA